MSERSRVQEVLGLTDAELKGLCAQFNLKDEDSKIYGLNLSDEHWASSSTIRSAVSYLGFDPKKIVDTFIELSKKKIDGAQKTRIGTSSDKEVYIVDGGDMQHDLLLFIILFLERGNNAAKILLKTEANVAEALRRKFGHYKIGFETKTKGPLGPTVLTLARIAQAFAAATITVVVDSKIRGRLQTKIFQGITLPIIMTHTIFTSALRSEDHELIEIAKYLNLEMSIMLSSPKDKRRMEQSTMADLLESSEKFVSAAVNGSSMTITAKARSLVRAELIDEQGKVSLIVMAMYKICQKADSFRHLTYSETVKKLSADLIPSEN